VRKKISSRSRREKNSGPGLVPVGPGPLCPSLVYHLFFLLTRSLSCANRVSSIGEFRGSIELADVVVAFVSSVDRCCLECVTDSFDGDRTFSNVV